MSSFLNILYSSKNLYILIGKSLSLVPFNSVSYIAFVEINVHFFFHYFWDVLVDTCIINIHLISFSAVITRYWTWLECFLKVSSLLFALDNYFELSRIGSCTFEGNVLFLNHLLFPSLPCFGLDTLKPWFSWHFFPSHGSIILLPLWLLVWSCIYIC